MSPNDSLHTLAIQSARLEPEWLITVYTPAEDAQKIIEAVAEITPLQYGNYDKVAFRSNAGVQQFRPQAGARMGAQARVFEMPTIELSFTMPQDAETLARVIDQVRAVHVAEEPVIYVQEVWSTRAATAGDDPANPNRFWNRPEYQDLK